MPTFKHVFLASAEGANALSGIDLDRRAFVARKRMEHETAVYFPSLSARTLVYKGMLITQQLSEFYPELNDERLESAWPSCTRASRRTRSRRGRWPIRTG